MPYMDMNEYKKRKMNTCGSLVSKISEKCFFFIEVLLLAHKTEYITCAGSPSLYSNAEDETSDW